jgi:alpha-galactosidase
MDPRELTAAEKTALKAAIALHQQQREFIHNADLYRLDSDGDSINFGLISPGKTKALFAYNSVRETARTLPPRYRFAGLEPELRYQIKLLWPARGSFKEYSASILDQMEGQIFSGEALQQFGMQLPIVHPQSSLVFELLAV